MSSSSEPARNDAPCVVCTVYTVGHSTHDLGHLLDLLSAHRITAIADVRSSPYSRMNPQFNREPFASVLAGHGIRYVFLGEELGARTGDESCYENGKVSYDRLARTVLFRRGLDRVQQGCERYRLALLCAEKEPLDCHRTILVARHLRERGLWVEHILEDGGSESHDAAIERLIDRLRVQGEDMFRSPEDVVADAYRLQGVRIAYAREAADEAVTSEAAEGK